MILVHAIGALLVICSYLYFLPRIGMATAWVGLSSPWRMVYSISILLAAIAYLITLRHQASLSLPLIAIFLLSAACWAPSMYFFPKHKWITVGVLTVTSFSVLLLLLRTSPKLQITKLAFMYLFLHCFLLDNLLWSYCYTTLPKTLSTS